MATSMDLFRKLGTGLKFDLKRFKSDAEKFQIVKANPKRASKQELERALDIFGSTNFSSRPAKDGRSTDAPVPIPTPKQTEAEGSKRKLEEGLSASKRRKSKKRKHEEEAGMDEMSENGGGMQLMTSLHFDNKREDNRKLPAEKVAQRRREDVNAFRRQHKIHVWGTDIPDPVGTFQELQTEYSLHSDIIENIHRAGFVEPTQIQMQAIPVMLHRRELLACAPTGSGKTAAFILPILAHLKEPRKKGFRAIVVSPTRELASQTYREFQRLAEGRGLRIHLIESTAKAAKKFSPEASQKFDILVTTPNRLVYLLKQEPPGIKLNSVEWLIVDESDKLFEEGKTGFRDQLATIYQACDSTHVRRAMFSATFTHDVEQWCKLNLDSVVMVTVGQRNTATELIQQEMVFVGGEYGKLLAVREIFRKGFQPPVLIFVQSKERAKELFQELIYDGYNVDVIHADKTQTQRDNIVKCFRSGKIWVLIATELMGRGIDFKGINLVINYDFPTSAISYIHRIGRTGRAGRQGKAVTFFTEDDTVHLRSIANVMRNAGCPVPDYMLQLKKLTKVKRKKLEKKPVKRDTVRTLPKQDLDKAKRKKEIIKKALKGKKKKPRRRKGSRVMQKEPHKTLETETHEPRSKRSKVTQEESGKPVLSGVKKQKTSKLSKVKVHEAVSGGKKSKSTNTKRKKRDQSYKDS
ncbi:probable ATP-dependent RNA helicase DDX52 [Acanthaster planci]|uniref:Probable ATP-dependent RNA helicase DDX52 n=1 Tax=Acanthaster planci TaxID=133434 RepID=A0A8B7Y013_ACAPL|nr:probable ATP-dependent RNA helicase DDX52 [Acanthaster planci]